MKIGKRLRIVREARELIRDAVAAGMSKEEAGEAMQEVMKAKYGADVDWMDIIELILKVLALFL